MISMAAPRMSTNGWRRAGPRLLAPIFAVLLLLVQIQASSCLPTATNHAPVGIAAFPICHGHSGEGVDQTGSNDHDQQHQATCPLCLVHCTACTLSVPPTEEPAQRWAYSLAAKPSVAIVRTAMLYPAGASPRGPPLVA